MVTTVNAMDIRSAKRQLIADDRANEKPVREARRYNRRTERRCFWTWPFGHLWRVTESGYAGETLLCRACGKRAMRYSP